MSVYNGERYLRQAIDSILNQTLTDFEFIIIDDASNDNTLDILTEYVDQDKRLRLIRNDKNIGLTKSLNRGLELARGEYVARQDADDRSLPERLERQVSYLDHHPEVVLVSSNIEIVDSEGCIIRRLDRACDPYLTSWYLLFYNHLGGHSQVLFRRRPVIELGGYSVDRPYCQDYELWLRLNKVGEIVVLPDVLLQWRDHSDSVSSIAGPEQENYTLTDARNSISELISSSLSFRETVELRDFWLGHPLDGARMSDLHLKLKEIYRGFLQERFPRDPLRREVASQLRSVIAKQLLRNARTRSTYSTLLLKLRVSRYALAWHPLAVLDYWVCRCKRLLSRSLSLILGICKSTEMRYGRRQDPAR